MGAGDMIQFIRALTALGEDQDSGLSTLMGSYSGRGPCALFWHLGTLHACHKLR